MNDLNAPPLNPLPPVVWLLALPMNAIEVAANAGVNGMIGGAEAVGWRAQLMQLFGFAPDYLRWMIETGQYPLSGLTRLVTYPLVHLGVSHALFVVVILLALGKFVGEIYRWWALLATYLFATIAGALAYTLVPYAHAGLLGGYPGDYGLIGAYSFLLWVRLAGSENVTSSCAMRRGGSGLMCLSTVKVALVRSQAWRSATMPIVVIMHEPRAVLTKSVGEKASPRPWLSTGASV